MLNLYYKDKVENLLFQLLLYSQKSQKKRIEGKICKLCQLAGFSGGVGGNYAAKALSYANEVGTCAQWAVEPGQVLFGVVAFNNKEVLASKNKETRAHLSAQQTQRCSLLLTLLKRYLQPLSMVVDYGEICATGYTTQSLQTLRLKSQDFLNLQ